MLDFSYPKILFLCFVYLVSGHLQAKDKVKIYLKWIHQYQFAGYYVAQEKGFFKEEGVEVELIERKPNEFPLNEVIKKEGLYAISDSSIVLHYLEGKPVTIISAIFQHSPLVFATKKENEFFSPLELKGKKIMYQVGQDDAAVTGMFSNVGLNKDDFIPIKHDFNLSSLYKGEVDAVSIYSTNQVFQMKKDGFNYHIIDPANYGVDFYGDMLVTSQFEAENNPERVKAIRRAILKGWKFALENFEEGIKIVKNYTKKDINLIRFEAEATKKIILPGIIDIGTVNLSRLERIAQVYQQHNKINSKRTNTEISFLLFDQFLSSKTFKYKILNWWEYLLGLLAMITTGFGLYSFFLYNKVKKQAVELKLINFQKEKFFSNITHELRTPLNGILGMCEILNDNKAKKEELADGLRTINYSAKILLEIVNDILDVSKMSASKFKLTSREFNLNELIEGIEKTFLHLVKNKNIVFEVNISNPLNANFYGDDVRILQILNNLLSNAFKYTPEGQVNLDIKVELLNNKAWTKFHVTDTGQGIKEESLKNLFLPFEQLEQSKDLAFKGTGLGLSITKELVTLMNGEIDVTSIYGKGTKFSISLPLEIAVSQGIQSISNKDEIKQRDLSSLKILLVDDNPINLKVLSKTIENLFQITPICVSSAKEALDVLKTTSFDFSFIDIFMPEMDGFELINQIHEQSLPSSFNIACTANDEKYKGEFKERGFDGYLLKPVKKEELFDLILNNYTERNDKKIAS